MSLWGLGWARLEVVVSLLLRQNGRKTESPQGQWIMKVILLVELPMARDHKT